jgi:hypothetical protein
VSDAAAVARAGKTVPRSDKCESCGTPVLYRVDRNGQPTVMFCPNISSTAVCPLALSLLPVPAAPAEKGESR